jgi:hypothetical protein
MKIPVHSKSRYIGLAVLADEIGCQMLIEQIPDLVQSLFNSLTDPTLTTHVSVAIEYVRYIFRGHSCKIQALGVVFYDYCHIH